MKIDISKWQTVPKEDILGTHKEFELKLSDNKITVYLAEDFKGIWDIGIISDGFCIQIYKEIRAETEDEAKENAIRYVGSFLYKLTALYMEIQEMVIEDEK